MRDQSESLRGGDPGVKTDKFEFILNYVNLE